MKSLISRTKSLVLIFIAGATYNVYTAGLNPVLLQAASVDATIECVDAFNKHFMTTTPPSLDVSAQLDASLNACISPVAFKGPVEKSLQTQSQSDWNFAFLQYYITYHSGGKPTSEEMIWYLNELQSYMKSVTYEATRKAGLLAALSNKASREKLFAQRAPFLDEVVRIACHFFTGDASHLKVKISEEEHRMCDELVKILRTDLKTLLRFLEAEAITYHFTAQELLKGKS